jgi:hypothetical protein
MVADYRLAGWLIGRLEDCRLQVERLAMQQFNNATIQQCNNSTIPSSLFPAFAQT